MHHHTATLSLTFALLLTAACQQTPVAADPDLGAIAEANAEREHAADRDDGAGAEAETDGPRQAREWRLMRLRDENGQIAPADIARAHSQRAALANVTTIAGVSNFGWVQVGPDNVGGRTRSLLIHPTNPLELWAGAVGGGVWHSLDGGLSWQSQDDFMGNIAISCLAMTPGSPSILYAGTGESGIFNSDAILGGGIWKTTNSGANWNLLAASTALGDVCRLAVSAANASLVLAATRSGIHRSTDGGASWTPVRPVNGTSFQVLFDPNNAANCVASILDAGSHSVLVSTDAGLIWTAATSGLASTTERIELAYANANPGQLYAGVGVGSGQCWRSLDGGNNWLQRAGAGLQGGGQMWYDNAIWVDPTNSNVIVQGTNNVLRSIDGGTSFTTIGNGYILTDAPHPDVHAIVNDPGYDGSTNRAVYVCSDGGIHHSTDIRAATPTSTWTARVTDYRTAQFYGAAGDGPTGRICGGTQDNGHLTIVTGSSPSATLTFGGDGGFAAMDQANPSFLYGEYVNLQIHRSSDGGASANYIWTGLGDANSGANSNFIAPFILDPNNPSTMLAGGRSLWRSTNVRAATPTWTSIKAAFGTNVGSAGISAIAVAPGNSDIVWVGHNGGRVYRTSNGTAAAPTWITVDDNGASNPLPNRYVERILVDHTDNNKVWICLGGFTANNVWLSTDGGLTWSARTGIGSGTLPQVPVHGICQHPTIANDLYLATDVGVFASNNYGSTWSTSNDGPADVSVDEIVFLHQSTTLLAATHGRGLWTAKIQEAAVATFGSGCPGSRGTPNLLATLPHLGQSVSFIATGLPASQTGFLVLGGSNTTWSGAPLPASLAPLGAPNCSLLVAFETLFSVSTTPVGTNVTVLPVPIDPGLLGGRAFLQMFVADPGTNTLGVVGSNGIALTVGN